MKIIDGFSSTHVPFIFPYHFMIYKNLQPG